ncbi:hypothetical protein [Neokomagataea thailandica]|uniref:Uncharacterized protein n=1 Tax=Neokomagataea tanensis NBRC 106556 TaxID=1223519 RepID=A0ABQ0QHA6_9PROT|nr:MULTISPECIES: hypothetical protein [Neokomagataea]GBR44809.1 hypothetical protein AA106556_0548 [Neokomagataea tanensis NBRC 106556]
MCIRGYVLCFTLFCAVNCASINPVLARGHTIGLKRGNAINTFVEPMVTAHFIDGGKLNLHENVVGERVLVPPALHYTWLGKVVQWWKRNVAAASAEPSLPDGTLFLHDPVTGAAIGRFGEAYVIAGPMGSGSAGTPGGH